MSFRVRMFLALAGAGLLPLVLFLLGARREINRRITAQFEDRVEAAAVAARSDLEAEQARLAGRVRAVAADLEADNRFRLALRGSADARYLLDYAEPAMRRAGLALLQVRRPDGRILSSGHFRNEYDRADSAARVLAGLGGGLVRTPAADGSLLVLAAVDSVRIGGESLIVVGGIPMDSAAVARLSSESGVLVALDLADASGGGGRGDTVVTSGFPYPYIDVRDPDSLAITMAQVTLAQPLGPLLRLRRSLDLWFLVASLGVAGLALMGAGWVSARVSRPLRELAEKTGRVDLDRLDVDFESDREDEVGALARLLGAMTQRLRASTARLREAERRATVGDLARQLNHDIKNGLVPIRNVFRHLTQVAKEDPRQLPPVLLERQETVDAGIGYLENLARNYARLTPVLDRQPCDLPVVTGEVVRALAAADPRIHLSLEPALPRVAADPLVIRRILENLVGNAVESLPAGNGSVTVSTAATPGGSGMVRLTVADTGRGMTKAELERAFEDFYSTKPGGTGLGLSVVKRLVLDLQGVLKVETEPGQGTTFIIDLPVAT